MIQPSCGSNLKCPKIVWIKERFNANHKKHVKGLIHYVGEEALNTEEDVRQKVISIDKDKEQVQMLCKYEIECLMQMAAEVTGMTHVCKLDGQKRVCKTSTDIRQSFCENQNLTSIKQVHWMFHQLPWETYEDVTLKAQTHQDVVVDKVKEQMNVEFMKEEEKDKNPKRRNCIEQMYSKVLNMKKQDLMKKGGGNTNDTQAFLKRPIIMESEIPSAKYKRSKYQFYWGQKTPDGVYKNYVVREHMNLNVVEYRKL